MERQALRLLCKYVYSCSAYVLMPHVTSSLGSNIKSHEKPHLKRCKPCELIVSCTAKGRQSNRSGHLKTMTSILYPPTQLNHRHPQETPPPLPSPNTTTHAAYSQTLLHPAVLHSLWYSTRDSLCLRHVQTVTTDVSSPPLASLSTFCLCTNWDITLDSKVESL